MGPYLHAPEPKVMSECQEPFGPILIGSDLMDWISWVAPCLAYGRHGGHLPLARARKAIKEVQFGSFRR